VIPLPVLFIQGAGDMRHPEGSGHLADYLGTQLGDGFRVIAPEMPDADDPHYRAWRDAIERELAAIDGPVVLVGHSFGGSVVLKYLAEGSFKGEIAGLFLVSVPVWGANFEEFALPEDFAARLPATTTFLYHSIGDPEIGFASMGRYERELRDATARPIPGSEHSFVNGLPVLVDDIRGVAR
jgi:predicted alpha/beta hydrolase family esterase